MHTQIDAAACIGLAYDWIRRSLGGPLPLGYRHRLNYGFAIVFVVSQECVATDASFKSQRNARIPVVLICREGNHSLSHTIVLHRKSRVWRSALTPGELRKKVHSSNARGYVKEEEDASSRPTGLLWLEGLSSPKTPMGNDVMTI